MTLIQPQRQIANSALGNINHLQLPKPQFSRLENVKIHQAPIIFHWGPGAGTCAYFHSRCIHFHTTYCQATLGSLSTAISWGSHDISQTPETEPFNYYLIEETLFVGFLYHAFSTEYAREMSIYALVPWLKLKPYKTTRLSLLWSWSHWPVSGQAMMSLLILHSQCYQASYHWTVWCRRDWKYGSQSHYMTFRVRWISYMLGSQTEMAKGSGMYQNWKQQTGGSKDQLKNSCLIAREEADITL